MRRSEGAGRRPRRPATRLPQKELPAGIERLLTRVRYSCSEPGYVQFRQDLLRKWVGEVGEAYENGWELLRQGAVAQLADDDVEMIDRAVLGDRSKGGAGGESGPSD